MDPFTIVAIVASALSASGVYEALRRVIRIALSPQERAGRPFRQIIRDAFKESPDIQPTLEERIQQLSEDMAQSGRLIKDIEVEIDARAAFAKQKKEEADESEAIKSANQAELDAFINRVRTEVSSEGNRGIRAAVILAVFSFVLGGAVTVIVTLFVHPAYDSSPRSPATPAPTSISSTP
jgi:hypothetical protein